MLAPLIDRIEVIQVPAYLPIEKLNIAKQYLVPGLEKEYGFSIEGGDMEKDSNASAVGKDIIQPDEPL